MRKSLIYFARVSFIFFFTLVLLRYFEATLQLFDSISTVREKQFYLLLVELLIF